MLDTTSLRVSFGVVALTLLVLFYFVTYRSSRSAYCGWWCVALLLFIAGSMAYVLNGTASQVWANPLGSCLLVAGSSAVWAGTRALAGRRFLPVPFVAAPFAAGVAGALADPATNVWAGGGVFLVLMAATTGLASRELWRVQPTPSELLRREHTFSPAVRAMAIMAAAFSAYYGARAVVYLAVGPDDSFFVRWFGTVPTTLYNTVLLGTVSFSMNLLSYERETEELRTRATRDGLTGLLNRAEFMRQASAEWRGQRRTGAGGSLVLADLDHFKRINDTYGHAAGDYALQAFAATCRGIVRSTDLVGRYGGEEFVVFLPGVPAERAQQIVGEISQRLRTTPSLNGIEFPTVSYGISSVVEGVDLEEAIELADHALYAAKAQGRDRAILSAGDAGTGQVGAG